MKVSKTLKYKIMDQSTIFHETLHIYNEALAFLIQVIDDEFPSLDSLSVKDMVSAVEKLIHTTVRNPFPKYKEFNQRFYKFPSYLRRAAIATAFGKVKSYRSHLQNWRQAKELAEQEGKKYKHQPPTLSLTHKEFPVLYKGNMYKKLDDTSALVKVFRQEDWIWIPITLKGQDLFKRGVYDWKECNPKLVQVGKKFFLHISYEQNMPLNKTPLHERRICAVDLGLTHSAVCSVLDANGTVLARTFINQAKEKDRLYRMTNKLRKAQRQSGWIEAPSYWNRITGLQKHIVHDTAHQIVAFAKEHDCDVIVFEYLGNMRVPKGYYGAKRLRFKLHYWRKTAIQNKITEMAHYVGMRISRINPRNTSSLAFDGSGQVERNPKRDIATFATGKEYHADLNASYNIGSRYFIRAYQKSISEMEWLSLMAKVPSLAQRTEQTLASFISLRKAIA